MRLTIAAESLIVAAVAALVAIPGSVWAKPPQIASMPPKYGVVKYGMVSDVALDDANRLHGRVTDLQGRPLEGSKVLIHRERGDSLTTATDEGGQFVTTLTRGGVYRIEAAEGAGIFRVWTAGTAPPASRSEVSIIAGALTIRGQSGATYQWISENPWQFYTMAAIAIAVPIAVVNHNRRSGS